MAFTTIDALKEQIVSELNTEFSGDTGIDVSVIPIRVSDAVRELRMKRNYTATSMKESQVLADIENYYSTIKAVARYDIVQMGAEGESRHAENGIDRSYINRDDLWKGVHAFVKVF